MWRYRPPRAREIATKKQQLSARGLEHGRLGSSAPRVKPDLATAKRRCRKSAARAPKSSIYEGQQFVAQADDQERLTLSVLQSQSAKRHAAERSIRQFGRNAGKTAATPVLMAEAWVRAPSIGKTGAPRALCEAAASAAADTACLGRGSATKTQVRLCFGRLSVVAGTGRARWLWQLVAVCWAEVPSIVAAGAGRALGPMLPTSARERWTFCVLRDSCHAALQDQPGLPSIGSGRRTGGSRHHPRPFRLDAGDHSMDAVGAGPCCVGVPVSNRLTVAQTALPTPEPK